MELERRGGEVTPRIAYQFGRLLAALEHLGATDQPRRLYVLASTAPAAMQPAIARASAQETGADLLTPIMAELPPDAFSRQLSDEESSDFALGYYHQRAEFRAGRLPALPDKEPDLEERWEIRIEPDLKRWAIEHGGGKLIRALLRAARER